MITILQKEYTVSTGIDEYTQRPMLINTLTNTRLLKATIVECHCGYCFVCKLKTFRFVEGINLSTLKNITTDLPVLEYNDAVDEIEIYEHLILVKPYYVYDLYMY